MFREKRPDVIRGPDLSFEEVEFLPQFDKPTRLAGLSEQFVRLRAFVACGLKLPRRQIHPGANILEFRLELRNRRIEFRQTPLRRVPLLRGFFDSVDLGFQASVFGFRRPGVGCPPLQLGRQLRIFRRLRLDFGVV